MASQSNWIAFITLIILIASSFGAIISYSVRADNDIRTNSNNIGDCKRSLELLSNSVLSHEKKITVIETHYEHISKQLNRIEGKLE